MFRDKNWRLSMGMPADANARRYYRVAFQRYDDGIALLGIMRPRAAIYLSGYAVECILKALIIVQAPPREQAHALDRFRGNAAHDIERLKVQLVDRVGHLPIALSRALSLVSSWSTELRYEPGLGDPRDAAAFLAATKLILDWANGKM